MAAKQVRARALGFVTAFWLVGLVFVPVFGYYLTAVVGWIDVDNWRSLLWVRISTCFLWPVSGALLNGLLPGKGTAWDLKTTVTAVVLSGYMFYPALNAWQDLRSGPEEMRLMVVEKEAEGHRTKSQRYTTYELGFSDGTTYSVEADDFARFERGASCRVSRLPQTDILLQLTAVNGEQNEASDDAL